MRQKEPSLLTLLFLVSFASVSAVLFVPSLPEITQKLQISNSQAQLTMTLFLIGYALGNLPYGPLSNRFGRKPVIYLGVSLAILGSFIIVLAGALNMFWLFLSGRFLSAIGSSVGMKISFTMIGDVYEKEQATKKISLVTLAFAIAPGLAIALGGYLTENFGWESCFYFLTVYSLFVLLLSFFLPETHKKPDKDALNLKVIQSSYQKKLRNKKIILCAMIMGCATTIIYLFASLGPFIGINHIGMTPEQYGLANFIPPIGMLIGSTLSHQLAGKKETLRLIRSGMFISLLVSTVMFLLFFLGKINFWTLFLPMPFLYIGGSLVYANSSGLAMSHAKDKSTASSLVNFINLMVCSVILFFAEALPSAWLYALPLLFLGMVLIMFLLSKKLSEEMN